ncbi:MAG: hypothetical protein GXP48_07370 [Acidobacteria bacterium]|nr:hypothetical protein [Acidobacteriota bacterium]
MTVACYGGVDVGSAYTKAVVTSGRGEVLAFAVLPTGLDMGGAGTRALAEACEKAGITVQELHGLVSTGYGRDDVAESDWTRSEILCLTKGAFALMGRAMTVVDIGGQDSKIVFLDERGARTDYRMNRKCAAGTGAFLEIIAMRLGVPLNELCELAERTEEWAPLGSFCSVFAATEVLDLLRRGYGLEAIARGVYRSVAHDRHGCERSHFGHGWRRGRAPFRLGGGRSGDDTV